MNLMRFCTFVQSLVIFFVYPETFSLKVIMLQCTLVVIAFGVVLPLLNKQLDLVFKGESAGIFFVRK